MTDCIGKELVLIRHAKSSWSDPSLLDWERPLNKRGKRDAPFMGKRLAEYKCLPDLIIASPTKRTQKTIRKICKQLAYPKKKIVTNKLLYTSDIQDVYRLVRSCKQKTDRLFLVGHNYVITHFAEELTGADIFNIPTCGIVGIRFDITSWDQVKAGKGELLFFDYPKKHARSSQ